MKTRMTTSIITQPIMDGITNLVEKQMFICHKREKGRERICDKL